MVFGSRSRSKALQREGRSEGKSSSGEDGSAAAPLEGGRLSAYARLLYLLVAALFGVAAAYSLILGIYTLARDIYLQVTQHGFDPSTLLSHSDAIANIITLVDDLLLTLIVLEVMETVLRLRKSGEALKIEPFLFIGIISATREILAVGARLSVSNPTDGGFQEAFQSNMVILGVNAGVVVALGLTLWLTMQRRADRLARASTASGDGPAGQPSSSADSAAAGSDGG